MEQLGGKAADLAGQLPAEAGADGGEEESAVTGYAHDLNAAPDLWGVDRLLFTFQPRTEALVMYYHRYLVACLRLGMGQVAHKVFHAAVEGRKVFSYMEDSHGSAAGQAADVKDAFIGTLVHTGGFLKFQLFVVVAAQPADHAA